MSHAENLAQESAQSSGPMTKRRWYNLAVLWGTYEISYLDRIAILIFLPMIRTDLGLTHVEAGQAASIFFFTYALVQFFIGGLADRWPVTRMIKIAITIFSVATFFMGMMRTHFQFLATRAALGFGEAMHIPPVFRAVANWFPSNEKARALAILTLSWTIGPAFLPPLLVWLNSMLGGWRNVFSALFIVGAIAVLVVHFVVQDDPETAHKRKKINDGELRYIKSGLLEVSSGTKRVLSTKELMNICFTQKSFWAYCFVWFLNLAMGWGVLAWMPSYLFEQHGLKLAAMGLVASIPWAAGAVGQIVGGWAYDKIKFFQSRVRYLIAGSFLVMIPASYTLYMLKTGDVALAVFCMSLIMFMVMGAHPVLYAYFQKRYPKETIGFTTGIANGIGQFGSFTAPILLGYFIVKTAEGTQYGSAYGVLMLLAFAGAVLSLFLSERMIDFQSILANKSN